MVLMSAEKAEALGVSSAYQLLKIDYARLEHQLWYEKYNHAGVMLEAATRKLKDAEQASETGRMLDRRLARNQDKDKDGG